MMNKRVYDVDKLCLIIDKTEQPLWGFWYILDRIRRDNCLRLATYCKRSVVLVVYLRQNIPQRCVWTCDCPVPNHSNYVSKSAISVDLTDTCNGVEVLLYRHMTTTQSGRSILQCTKSLLLH